MLNRLQSIALCAGILLSSQMLVQAVGTAPASPSVAAIKEDKVKSIIRRDPRAADLIPKVDAKIAAMKAQSDTAAQAAKLEQHVNQILMTGSGMTDTRLREDINILAAIAGTFKQPTAAELAPLQERYKKVAEDLDDRILVKDFDRIVHKHDRFIRYTSLGLWDANTIAEELGKMEKSIETAPDIVFGRTELLRGLQDRRLMPVPKLIYMGTFPHEEIYVSGDRRSVGMLEEATAVTLPLETVDFVLQGPGGELVDLTTANHPIQSAPFAPPLSLWMKARMLEGRVPAITFRLIDKRARDAYAAAGKPVTSDAAAIYKPQDIIDGKLDEYFNKNLSVIYGTKEASMVGLFDQFDREMAVNSFGADGKTPFYLIADAKLAKLPPEQAEAEYLKRAEKGGYAKLTVPELSNQYGDATVPDGPERVRDAWKHVQQLLASKSKNVSFYSSAGAFHGSKAGSRNAKEPAGNQSWNKLEFYYPGEGIMDWIGTEAYGTNPATDPKGPNVVDAIAGFMGELKGSKWADTLVMLRGAGPAAGTDPNAEGPWLENVFQRVIPTTYPNISVVFLHVPGNLSLWSRDAVGAFRTHIASNKLYKYPLRFKMLEETKAP